MLLFFPKTLSVPRPAGRRPSRKKSPTTALNHSTRPSAHTDNFKQPEAKKCALRPLRYARPPEGGSTLSRSILDPVRA